MSDLIHKTTLSALTGIFIFLSVSDISGQSPNFNITDSRDSKVYPIVHIGFQWWTAQNLDIGTMIPSTTDMTDNAIIEKHCIDNNSAYCDTFGGLYMWDELMQYTVTESTQGICPDGWHIPSDDEWKTLESALGMPQTSIDSTGYRGTTEGGKLKGTDNWIEPNVGATNEVGFNLLPAGGRDPAGTIFYDASWTDFWTSTEYSQNDSFASWRMMVNSSSKIFRSINGYKPHGTSVRCVKNTPDYYETGSFTDDRDGHVYKTVLIGEQQWMAENLDVGLRIDASSTQTNNTAMEKYCYNDIDSYCESFGGLYTWDEMMQYTTDNTQGICPDGWHIPSDDDWKQLERELDMDEIEINSVGWDRGTFQGIFLHKNGGSGFDASLGGAANPSGDYSNLGAYGYYWSSDASDANYSWGRVFGRDTGTIARNNYYHKRDAFSVRCVKNIPINLNLQAPDTVCASQEFDITAQVDGGTGVYTYSWTSDPPGMYPGDNTIPVSPTTDTKYYLTVNDGESTARDSILIVVNPSPVLDLIGPTSLCTGEEEGTEYSTPDNPNYQYSWVADNGEITSADDISQIVVNWVSTAQTRSLSLVVTDKATGCETQKQISVNILSLPESGISGPTSVCAGEVGTAYSTTDNVNYLYNWSAGDGDITTASDISQILVDWGTTVETKTLNLVVTDNTTGCEAQKQITVEVVTVPSFSITGPTTVCAGVDSIAYSSAYDLNYQYEWSASNGQIITATDGNQIEVNWGTTAETKTLNLRVSIGSSGCGTQKQINVEVLPLPESTITGPTNVCAGEEGTAYSTVNNTNYQYGWSTDNGNITSAANINQIVVDWGTTAETKSLNLVVVDNVSGCETQKQISIEILPVPSFNIVGPEIVCAGEKPNTYSTQNNTDFQFDWFTDNGQITTSADVNQIIVDWGMIPGMKTLNLVVASTTSGCQAEKQISVEVKPMPVFEINGPTAICAGEEAQAYSTVNNLNYTYKWQTENGVITTASDKSQTEVNWGITPGTKTLNLEITDNTNGCHAQKQVNVEVRPSPEKPDMVRKAKSYIFICKDSGQIYQWYHDGIPITGETKQFYYIRNTTDRNGTISVEISSVNGCKNMSEPYVFSAKSSAFNEDSEQNIVFIHPNPNNGLVTIEIFDDYTGLMDIKIINGLGQIVRHIQITKATEIFESELDLRQVEAGIYFMIFQYGMNREIHRIFINRTN